MSLMSLANQQIIPSNVYAVLKFSYPDIHIPFVLILKWLKLYTALHFVRMCCKVPFDFRCVLQLFRSLLLNIYIDANHSRITAIYPK